MPSLKELRIRINSIRSTQKITAAMKMVAASRLRRAQALVTDSAAYIKNVTQTSSRLIFELQQEEKLHSITYIYPHLMRPPLKQNKYLLLVFSSDRGLAGNFNYQVAKSAQQRIEELQSAGAEVKLICIGKKAADIIKRTYPGNILEVREGLARKGADYEEMEALSQKLVHDFEAGEFDICEIITSQFITAMTREVRSVQVLPLSLPPLQEVDPTITATGAIYEYDGDRLEMLSNVLPLLFRGLIFQAMVHSQASEQSARMTSMDNATRNAKDMINKLTLRYNGIRQSAITTELIEIIAGAEAV